MPRPNRLLKGLKKLSASLPLVGTRHPGTPEHARHCADCAAALHRQRQYLERLRDAAVPAASDELTARLLLRTQQLAMQPAAPSPRREPLKLAGLAAGGVAMVAAGAVVAGAYIFAGEPRQYAAASLFGQAGVPVEGPASTGGAATGGGDGRGPSVEASVAALRSSGWACPDLQAMGFHVVSATSKVLAGRPAVELRLSDGRHTATVLEQRAATATGSTVPPSAAAPPAVPLNPLTGRPANRDGFVAVDAAGEAFDGRLWIRAAAPWSAIYQTPRTTFTYVSDLPAHSADDAVAALVAAAGGATDRDAPDRDAADQDAANRGGTVQGVAAGAGTDAAVGGSANESVVERLERGLRRMARHLEKITEHLAP